jgi:hypothetical protein
MVITSYGSWLYGYSWLWLRPLEQPYLTMCPGMLEAFLGKPSPPMTPPNTNSQPMPSSETANEGEKKVLWCHQPPIAGALPAPVPATTVEPQQMLSRQNTTDSTKTVDASNMNTDSDESGPPLSPLSSSPSKWEIYKIGLMADPRLGEGCMYMRKNGSTGECEYVW